MIGTSNPRYVVVCIRGPSAETRMAADEALYSDKPLSNKRNRQVRKNVTELHSLADRLHALW
jgi:hypothetical protein